MKFSDFTRVFAYSGLAAVTAPFVIAQQPVSHQPASSPSAATASTGEVSPDTVVLTIGDKKITRAEFDQVLAVLAQSGRAATTPAQKRAVAEQYGQLVSMAQEARKRKLDASPEAKTMISIQRDSVLANMLAKQVSQDVKFTDLDLRGYYDSHKQDFEEAQASHILIRFKGSRVPLKPNEKDLTDEEALAKAQQLRAKIAAGGDFAAIAKAESDDPGSAVKGGELGTFHQGQMVPEFDKAAFSLPVGQVSEPIKTQFGYHLIKVTSRTTKTFEEAKPEIEKQLRPEMMKQAMAKLQAQAPVTLNEQFFGK